MKRSRFTEEQIISILKEQEVRTKTADVCRRHGISEAPFYRKTPTFHQKILQPLAEFAGASHVRRA